MIFSSALGIVGLCYSIVILCLYFWKKKANIEGRLTTLLFKILVVSLAIIGFIEIGCIWSIVTIDQHPILTEVVCRLHILADIVWMTIVLVYIYVVTVDSNIIGAYVKTRRILGIVLIIFDSLVYILSCALNVTFHSAVNPNYLVIGGPALYPVYALGGIGSIAILIMMLRYRKTKPKELNLPIIFFGISFVVITGLEFVFFNYRVNYIYFLYAYLLIAMYFTVESQDTRLLSQAEESRQEAERANQAKSDFLSSISHEIRTPMNTILGFSQAMLEEKHLTEDIVKRDTKDIKAASADLLELINNILDISRIESGKETVDLKEYKIEDLLFEVNSVIVSKVSRDVLDFKINVDGNIPTKYKGDSDKLFKILVNILANAISHTKFGSVSLDVGGAYVGETFKLSLIIANTGHEMTESEFNRSFEDFSEEGSTIGTDSIKLGLIVAKRLIEMLGGSIDFRNEKAVEDCLNKNHDQLVNAKGIDHPYIIYNEEAAVMYDVEEIGNKEIPYQITLSDSESKRMLRIYTTAPAVQVYTGNYLEGGCIGKGGKAYKDWSGIALETECFPNAINTENKDQVILKAGDIFKSQSVYSFFVMKE